MVKGSKEGWQERHLSRDPTGGTSPRQGNPRQGAPLRRTELRARSLRLGSRHRSGSLMQREKGEGQKGTLLEGTKLKLWAQVAQRSASQEKPGVRVGSQGAICRGSPGRQGSLEETPKCTADAEATKPTATPRHDAPSPPPTHQGGFGLHSPRRAPRRLRGSRVPDQPRFPEAHATGSSP